MILLACAYLLVGAAVSASAASNQIQPNSGGIDLDPIITENKTIPGVKQGKMSVIPFAGNYLGAPNYAVDAGGGKFWVNFSTYVSSYYNHPALVHRVSATNSNGTTRSAWKEPFDIAFVRVPATLWGNRANWDTK